MKAVFSTVALAGLVVGCSPPGDTSRDTSSDMTSDELRGAPRIIETVEQHNLVSDQPKQADFTDARLLNAWGLAFSPRGTGWVSANGSGISFVFNGDGSTVFTVNIPEPVGVKGVSAPTGQVFNADTADFRGDAFIFVTEDGTVSGWQGGPNAVLRFTAEDGAIYKGVAIANASDGRHLYATDFHNNKIDVFDDHYQRITQKGFVDASLPANFAPFNVATFRNVLFVTYAMQDADKEDDVKGPGNGFVDVFDADGLLLDRLIARGALNSPWGLAIAPDDFGRASNKLLVGNFGDGHISAYTLSFQRGKLNATFAGQLGTSNHRPLVIDGLWAIVFGPGVNGFDDDEIYFTAGPNDEADGLFGELEVAGKKKK